MTKEEILKEFSDINEAYNNCTKYDTLERMLDELMTNEEQKWTWTEEENEEIFLVVCEKCGNAIRIKKRYKNEIY